MVIGVMRLYSGKDVLGLGPSNWYSCFWSSARINNYDLRNFSNKFKLKVHLSDSPHVGIQNTTAKRQQHAHSDEIV